MKQIDLYRENGSWVAWHYQDGEPDPRILALFGTHGLPTAFKDRAPAALVLSEIRLLNPEAKVRVRVR